MGLFSKFLGIFGFGQDTKSASSTAAEEIAELKNLIAKKEDEIALQKNHIETLQNKYKEETDSYKEQLSSLSKQLEAKGIDPNAIKELADAQITSAEVDSLKKKLSKLEEELEDAEDDLDAAKKKVKAKEMENGELQDEIAKRKKEISQLTEELDSTKHKLEDKLSELEIKMESLAFVQEILTAKQTSDASVQARYKAVEAIFDFITGDLHDGFNQINSRNNPLDVPDFKSSLEHWRYAARKNWLDGKTTIAFVGEFSAGKTSIVNRILSQDDPNVPTLPVSTKATTAIPTYISGTPYAASYNFLSKDNILKNISEETFKRVSKEVLDQVGGVSALIENFVMKYKNPNLEKMSILDTPGFNSNDPEDARHTLDVINECDALFWVFDVNAGTVNRSSIELIKKNLRKPLYVVINKVDTKADSEVDKVESLIKDTLSKEGVKVEKFVRFSAKAPLSLIMDPIESVPMDQSQAVFLERVLDIIGQTYSTKKTEMQNKNKEYQELERVGSRLVEQFNRTQNSTWNMCDEASKIPIPKDHWFREANFEMSKAEHSRLMNLLNNIAGSQMSTLANLFNQRVDNAQQSQHTYEELNTLKVQVNALSRLGQQYKKLVNTFEEGK